MSAGLARRRDHRLVRDSKDPEGARLALTGKGFTGLVALARAHG